MDEELDPPSCLSAFVVSRTPEPRAQTKALGAGYNAPTSVFGLACSCGGDIGQVLGHWLVHPDRPPEKVFVSPLSFRCESCGAVTQLLDTAVHGYDALNGGDYNMHGEGEQELFSEQAGRVIAFFSYQGFEGNELEEMAAELGAPPADLFDTCAVYLAVLGSQELVPVADFELA